MENDLTSAIQKAAEIAKQVPENLQEAAFNRALDQLLGGGVETVRPRKDANRRKVVDNNNGQATDRELIEKIDRTRCPDVGATARVADRALKVMQLAQTEYGVDGLTGAQIAEILTQKFRLGVTANAVNMALQRETDTVNTRLRDGVRVFHLMAPGEDYLKRLRGGEVTGQRRVRSKATNSHRPAARSSGKKSPKIAEPRATRSAAEKATTDTADRVRPDKKTPTRSRPGPKAALEQLLNAGFFDSARLIADIQEHLKHKRGHTYTVQDLSPALVRLVRDEKLDRERNSSGQYEYTRAK